MMWGPLLQLVLRAVLGSLVPQVLEIGVREAIEAINKAIADRKKKKKQPARPAPGPLPVPRPIPPNPYD
jgi:hypothetical protein